MIEANHAEPKVSIIIPCYNREDYISDAVDSCLRQTYKNIEIIVVDDGSSDNSVDVITSNYSNKLLLITQENKGTASARNKGLNASSGEFVIFLDSDDWITDDLVESHIKTLNRWPEVDICCADSAAVDNNGEMSGVRKSPWPDTPANPLQLFLLKPPPFPACEIYRKSTILKHGGFDEDMKAFTDAGIRLKIVMSGGLVVRTQGGYAVYRPVANSITKNNLKIHRYAIKMVDKLLVTDDAKDPQIKSLIHERLQAHRLRYWNSWLQHHFSLKPISILKFARQLARVMTVDSGYLWFVIKHKPWHMPPDKSF